MSFTDPSARSLLQTLELLAADAGPEGYTLDEIMARLDEEAFGAALFVLALPCCVPFLYVVPQIVSLPMIALAVQMALGRERPWLPAGLAARRIDKAGLTRTAAGARRWLGWIELFARPRLTFMTGKGPEVLIGAILTLFCALILVPLPMTNTVPGFAVALASFGLMARDGVLILGGLILGSAWAGVLGAIAVYGLDAVRGILGF